MIQAFLISLLSANNAKEFSYTYTKGPLIKLSGKFINGEWVTSGRVESEMFIHGWNNLHTGSDDHNLIIAHLIMEVLTYITEYNCNGKDALTEELRSVWKNK